MRTALFGMVVGASLLALGGAPVDAGAAPVAGGPEKGVVSEKGTSGGAAPDRGVGEKPAEKAAQVKAEILVLLATNEGKGIDPSIGKLPQLGQPPFSAYNTYKLLEKAELVLPKGEAKDRKLPDGGRLALTFKDAVAGKKKDEPTRYQLSTTIEKPDGKAFLPGLDVSAMQNEYFFVAGQQHKGGILVIGIKILP